MSLQWGKSKDDFDNTVHVAGSSIHDDESLFWWSVGPFLQNDTVIYTLRFSDKELTTLIDEDGLNFPTPLEAMFAAEQYEKDLIAFLEEEQA